MHCKLFLLCFFVVFNFVRQIIVKRVILKQLFVFCDIRNYLDLDNFGYHKNACLLFYAPAKQCQRYPVYFVRSVGFYVNKLITFTYFSDLILRPATIIPKSLAFFTQMLWMFLCLIWDVKPVRFVQRSLLVWIDVDVTFYTHLSHVSPAVPAHPLSFACRAFVFTKTSFLALIGCQSLAFGSCLFE